MANLAAIDPPRIFPTSAGGVGQVLTINLLSQLNTRLVSNLSLSTVEEPCPGRSGTITRLVFTSFGITLIHQREVSPGPCSRIIGGPSPPLSTAVDIPARSIRCSEM